MESFVTRFSTWNDDKLILLKTQVPAGFSLIKEAFKNSENAKWSAY